MRSPRPKPPFLTSAKAASSRTKALEISRGRSPRKLKKMTASPAPISPRASPLSSVMRVGGMNSSPVRLASLGAA